MKMTSKKIFHFISYLSVLFYCWAIYFLIQFAEIVKLGNNGWEQMNNILVLAGIGLAFSSLKDPNRNYNFISKRIRKNEVLSILIIILVTLSITGLILFGLLTMFFSKTYRSEAIAVGTIVLGIGLIGYLKYIVERLKN